MQFVVLTLFPELFGPFFSASILGKAVERGLISARAEDIRAHTHDRHNTADDRPFGGGCGMVMKPEPLAAAIRAAREKTPGAPVVLMSPQGRVFDQACARVLAAQPGLILVCGRYEGVDERVVESLVDYEVSLGDFVLTGGEPAALCVMDAVARLVPGVLGKEDSAVYESFEQGLLEHAHYTRPRDFEGAEVPEVLLGGHHAVIEKWRREASLGRTLLRRPDLLSGPELSDGDAAALERWRKEITRVLESRNLSGTGTPSGGQQAR